jgi:hypothetical protein
MDRLCQLHAEAPAARTAATARVRGGAGAVATRAPVVLAAAARAGARREDRPAATRPEAPREAVHAPGRRGVEVRAGVARRQPARPDPAPIQVGAAHRRAQVHVMHPVVRAATAPAPERADPLAATALGPERAGPLAATAAALGPRAQARPAVAGTSGRRVRVLTAGAVPPTASRVASPGVVTVTRSSRRTFTACRPFRRTQTPICSIGECGPNFGP